MNATPSWSGRVSDLLGIVRRFNEYAFHRAKNGRTWRMMRHVGLAMKGPLNRGFATPAVSAAGLAARFSSIRYEAATPGSIRKFPR